ncbi:MAG TPA: alpha/beta hydrolase, partial [Ktedonobacteraceae bacterium]|nr:alpha/beta hydrolase [Ktedonobacteraceae bacterium]
AVFTNKLITLANGWGLHTRISREVTRSHLPPFVLVHGLSVSSGYLMPTAHRLAAFSHVYVPDLPGFGRSPNPTSILNIDEMANAFVPWMQQLGLDSAIFLGNSLGCQIIANLAAHHPERVEQAILVSPTMDPRALTIHQEFGRLLRDALCEPLHFLPVLLGEYLQAGILRTIRTLQYAFADPVEKHLRQMHAPTLVVRGSRDPIIPQSWAEKVARLLPHSQFTVIQGAAHAVNYDAPEKLVDAVLAFLRSHRDEADFSDTRQKEWA